MSKLVRIFSFSLMLARKREESSERHDADGHVDIEDPTPAEVGHDQPAQDGAQDGAHHRGNPDHAHHAPHALGTGGSGQDALADGQDHAAAQALQNPEGDQ